MSVFPGGDQEGLRSWRERNQIDFWPDQVDHAGDPATVPVVPMTIHGERAVAASRTPRELPCCATGVDHGSDR